MMTHGLELSLATPLLAMITKKNGLLKTLAFA